MNQNVKKRQPNRTIAIQVCPSKLFVAICTRINVTETNIRTHSVTWRKEATSFQIDAGRDELVEALRPIIEAEKIQGEPVYVSLDGDFCVTRTVTGDESRVTHELDELTQRSSRYLTLGHGQKLATSSVRKIDARNRHGLLTVVNARTLDALDEVADRVNVKLAFVEASLLSLCRLSHFANPKNNNPHLIVNIGERGLEMGIAHRGYPLLDYRPAGKDTNEHVAKIVGQNLARLRRYCDRYVRFAEGNLEFAYLIGDPSRVDKAVKDCEQLDSITSTSIALHSIDPSWNFEDGNPDVEFGAAIGVALLGMDEESQYEVPNLLDQLSQKTTSILPLALKALWPIAAAALVLIVLKSLVMYEESRIVAIEHHAEPAQQESIELQEMSDEIFAEREFLNHLTSLKDQLRSPDWKALSGEIGQCLPPDSWLESLSASAGGKLTIHGVAMSEEGTYSFVKALQTNPAVNNVALSGTQPAGSDESSQIEFDVHADLIGYTERGGESDDEH